MTIYNLISWLQEAEDNNTWLVSTQSVKRHLEKIKETEQFSLHGVSHRRELLINFRDWCDTNLNYDGIFDSEIDTYLKDKIK
jgi:hypothetical protein